MANLSAWRTVVRDYFERNASNPTRNSSRYARRDALPHFERSLQRRPAFLAASLLAASLGIEQRAERLVWVESSAGVKVESATLLSDAYEVMSKCHKFSESYAFQEEDPLVHLASVRLRHLQALLKDPEGLLEGWRLQLHTFLETNSSTLCPPATYYRSEVLRMNGCLSESMLTVANLLVRYASAALKRHGEAIAAAHLLKAKDALHMFPEDSAFLNALLDKLRDANLFVPNEGFEGSEVQSLMTSGNHDEGVRLASLGDSCNSVLCGRPPIGWPVAKLREQWWHSYCLQNLRVVHLASECEDFCRRNGEACADELELPDAVEEVDASMKTIDLAAGEYRIFSQTGEDGALYTIFRQIGVTKHRFVVEFGAEDGREGQARYLRVRHGFRGVIWDNRFEANAQIGLEKRLVDLEDLEGTFASASVPPVFDLLSLDINGGEDLVWQSLSAERFRPRVVCVEHVSGNTTIATLQTLAASRGYTLVYINPINAIFVSDHALQTLRAIKKVEFLNAGNKEALCAQPQGLSSLGYGRPGSPRC
mmetsp:Transcript_100981/g.283716  ORF Transcript_100981/g.283716 Transcript_100981/m.283716 type:complete len:537 (-) Transcript_100981:71-1681(-)